MKQGFEYNSKFNMDSSFSSIKFGYDRPVLEIELNEMQEIQNHNRKLLTNKICKSGIVEMIDKDFMGQPIVYNPNNELNKIALAPMKVMVNGYEVHVCGNYSIGQINNYILIDLGDAPNYDENYKPYRQDLVYLQVWFEELCGKEQLKRYGHHEGTVIPNTIIDVDRVGEETSHRMVLKWKIKTSNILIDFDRWEYGFGFTNTNDGNYVRIETDITKGINIKNKEYDKIFANATHYMFKGCTFYGDNNLWLAGRPHENDVSNTKDSEYVYALPLFRIDRRNKEKYDISNPHGSKPFEEQNINLRPDNKCYDLIYPSDILDLRKTIIIGNADVEYHADNTLNDLFNGKLDTTSNEKMRRIQFGVTPLSVDTRNLIFLDSFTKGENGLPVPLKPQNNQPILKTTTPSIKPYYEPNVTEWGIKINNTFQLEYDMLKSEETKINKYEGTIEFFITPEWNGFEDINQRILGLYFQAVGDEELRPFITIDKMNVIQNDEVTNKIVINRYNDKSNEPVMSSMNIGCNGMLKDNIYHFRIGWSKSNNAFDCYINGKKVANALDMNMLKDVDNTGIGKLIIGYINDNTYNNVGFIMDELSIYNSYLGNENWLIPQDFREGNAIILPSFNGIYRDFRGNLHEQENLVNYLTPSINAKQFTITLPCRLKDKISFLNNPKVYCLKRSLQSPETLKDGEEIFGTWSSVDNDLHQATFKLDSNNKISAFKGEKVAIVYGLKITGHNNINDIPNQVLKSEIMSDTGVEEVAFNLENKNSLSVVRDVNKLVTKIKDEHGNVIGYEPVRNIYNVHDMAYDLSSYRDDSNRYLSFCRMLDYYVEGNNTRQYNVNTDLYGHKALYIKSATLMTTNTYGDENIEELKITDVSIKDSIFDIKIDKVVMSGSKIKFEIALASVGFDYNMNSKTYVGNVYKSQMLEITATGSTEEYIIELDSINDGMCSNGVLIGAGAGYGYVDNIEDPINKNYENICYVDNVLQKYEFIDGYNKPFIKIKINKGGINSNEFIEAGKIIRIPILTTYQPKSFEILSVWYNYTPYQGILGNSLMELKRLSDWKYFITTLSSGNENDNHNIKNSISNIVNRLPGGLSASSRITGQDIILKNHNMNDYAEINNYEINKKLIFTNQTYNSTRNNNYDDGFFKLTTDYKIRKKFAGMQDDCIYLNDMPFKIYLPINEDDCSINRYCGMYCIVANEYGDLYLLLIGSTNNNVSTNNNFIYPEYGDLFIIKTRPSISNNN